MPNNLENLIRNLVGSPQRVSNQPKFPMQRAPLLNPTPMARQAMPSAPVPVPSMETGTGNQITQSIPQGPDEPNLIKKFVQSLGAGMSTMPYSKYDSASTFAGSFGKALSHSGKVDALRNTQNAQTTKDAEQQNYDRSMEKQEMDLKQAADKRKAYRDSHLNDLTSSQIKKVEAEVARKIAEETGKMPTPTERTNARRAALKQVEALRAVDDNETLTTIQATEAKVRELMEQDLREQAHRKPRSQGEPPGISKKTSGPPQTGSSSLSTSIIAEDAAGNRFTPKNGAWVPYN